MKRNFYLSVMVLLATFGSLFATPVMKMEINDKAAQKISYTLDQIGQGQQAVKIVNLCNEFLNNVFIQRTPSQIATTPYMNEMLMLYWDINEWSLDIKQLHLYDANGLNTEVHSWEWENNQWVKSTLMVMTYNAQDDPISTVIKMWDDGSMTWEDFAKLEMTYDASGNPLEYLIKINFGGMWMDLMKMSFTHNAQNQMTEVITQSFDLFGGMTWENDSRSLYTYNAIGKVDEILQQDWDGSGWQDASKYIHSYNSSNDVSEVLSMYWGGSWLNYQRTTYTYDGQGNNINQLVEIWDNTLYLNDSQTLFTHDSQGRVTVEVRQYWSQGAWENDEQVLWTYDQPVGISAASVLSADFHVYPNPTTDRITLFAELINPADQVVMMIFDATGCKAMEQSIGDLQSGTHTLPISLDGLRSGNYIVVVKCSQDVLFRQKLMVVR